MMSEDQRCWEIEYEIPPLRAIYHGTLDGDMTEVEVREFFKTHNPPYKIRNLNRQKLICKACDCPIDKFGGCGCNPHDA